MGENAATLTLLEVAWMYRFCIASLKTAKGRVSGCLRKMGGKARGRGGMWSLSLCLSPLVVTIATLLEFHKSLWRSRKWLPGFGMLFSGRCRHCWNLCSPLRPPPPLSLSTFPLFLSPPFFFNLSLSFGSHVWIFDTIYSSSHIAKLHNEQRMQKVHIVHFLMVSDAGSWLRDVP